MKRGAVLLSVLVLAWAPGAKTPGPSASDYVRGARAAKNAACVSCHSATAAEHARSLHAASFSDASFQRGYVAEPKAFCRSCHAPEANPDAPPDPFAERAGVTCVTCHLPETSGRVHTSGTGISSAPHAVERSADFGTKSCARCHEFTFSDSKALMQKTLAEHAASAAQSRSCTSCHADHRFAASRESALLRRSLDARAERNGEKITFTLASLGVGHAFPTGDLFRRLVLRVRGSFGVIEEPFHRTFGSSKSGGHFEVDDTRLQPTQTFEIFTRSAVIWEVVYQRVTFASQLPPFAATIEAETVLRGGEVR